MLFDAFDHQNVSSALTGICPVRVRGHPVHASAIIDGALNVEGRPQNARQHGPASSSPADGPSAPSRPSSTAYQLLMNASSTR
jgi:hypothetical protein